MSFLKKLEKINTRSISIEDFCKLANLTYEDILKELEYTPEDKPWRDFYSFKYEYYKDGIKNTDRFIHLEEGVEERVVSVTNLRFNSVSRTIDLFICRDVFKVDFEFGQYETYDDIMTYYHNDWIIDSEKRWEGCFKSEFVPYFCEDASLLPFLIEKLGEVKITVLDKKFLVEKDGFKIKASTLSLAICKLVYRVYSRE